MICAYLSIVLLVGLGANALLGWWWADPVAALVIAAVALREGRGAESLLRRSLASRRRRL
jgi:divalent metal cation (Fe/Co/Zn/Cd) transporter